MNTQQYETMMQGLISTAKEKLCVLGIVNGIIEANNIRTVISELETFWNSDGSLSSEDYEGIIDIVVFDFEDTLKGDE